MKTKLGVCTRITFPYWVASFSFRVSFARGSPLRLAAHDGPTCLLDSRSHLVEPAPVRHSAETTAESVCATGDSGGHNNHHESSTRSMVAKRGATSSRRSSQTTCSKPTARSCRCRARTRKPAPTCRSSRCRARARKRAPTRRSDALAGHMVYHH